MDEPGRFERSMRESTPGTTPLRSRARSAGPRSRRVLLLTSGLGYGHRRASDAIREALAELSPGSVTCDLDFWSLMNPGVAGSIQQMYLQVVQRHSALYDRVYALDEHTWRRISAYWQHLVRRHPNGPALNAVLDVAEPDLPGWARYDLTEA